jgi:hypothetical protein
MAPHPISSAAAALLACSVIPVLGTLSADAQAAQRNQPPEPLERLWSEYPLNPGTPEPSPQIPDRTQQPPAAEPPTKPVPGPGPSSVGSSWSASRVALVIALVAAAVAGLTAVAMLLISAPVAQPFRLQAFGAGSRVPGLAQARSQKGSVWRFVRDGSRERKERVRLFSRAGEPAPEQSVARPEAIMPNFLRRSDAVNTQPPEPFADRAEVGEGDVSDEREFASPAHLGEHVTAVIASAQQASEQIRAEAVKEAERIRAEAREEAGSRIAEATREAEKMRTDTGAYSRETRQDADAYAAEKRSEAEAYASRVRTEAEENARAVREAAKQDAKRAEKDAHRRKQILTSEVERFEERLQSLHTVFQGMTSQLATLIPKEDKVNRADESEPGAEEEPQVGAEEEPQESMEESLTQGASSRAASKAAATGEVRSRRARS